MAEPTTITIELTPALREEIAKQRICGVVCNCGPEGEPLACGYPPLHDGNHSWASIPTFCYGQHKWTSQRQGGAPDDAGSYEVVTHCKNCGSEPPDES